MKIAFAVSLLLTIGILTTRGADDADALVIAAKSAYAAGDYEKAVAATGKALVLIPKHVEAHTIAAQSLAALKQFPEAIKSYTKVIELSPTTIIVIDRRGDALLKSGRFKDAIADFDDYLAHDLKAAPDHWRRGIALYYAGRYADGVKQFNLHRKVNPEDVENSAWHYLCTARAVSPKQARADLIPVTRDSRIPMKQVLQLFAGTIAPEAVLAAAEEAKLTMTERTEARFYARLYVALYFDSTGDDKQTRKYLEEAVEKYPIGHYMWDVAKAHLSLLKEAKK